MKKRKAKDQEEKALLEAYEKGQFKPATNQKKLASIAKKAAGSYLKKDARVNIRISESDLQRLKGKAAEEGMPYQTLIASVLHKFVSGRLTSKDL